MLIEDVSIASVRQGFVICTEKIVSRVTFGGALILGLGGVRDSLLGVLTTIVEALTNALPS